MKHKTSTSTEIIPNKYKEIVKWSISFIRIEKQLLKQQFLNGLTETIIFLQSKQQFLNGLRETIIFWQSFYRPFLN